MDFPEFFGDDYFQDDSVNEDSFEDNLEAEMDEPLTGDAELEGEPIEAESEDYDFTVKDAFFLGGAMGFGYEQGLRERRRRKRESSAMIQINL